MKNITKLLAISLLVAGIFTGCNGKANTSTSSTVSAESTVSTESAASASQEEIKPDDNLLIMATEAGFRPYEYYEGTDIVGVDVDIAKEIAAAMGKTLLVENMEFGAIIPAVNSGKAHFGAAGMSITEDRQKQVDFTIEYATSKQVILTKKDSTVKSEADLEGKIVGVQLGTVADIVLAEDYPNVNLEQYNKYFDAANDLINGRIEAIVLDVLPAQEILKMDESLIILEEALFTDVYAFCVKKDNKELLDALNLTMQKLLDEGKITEYTTKHSA